MPDVPTIAQAGLTGYEVPLWYSILAPANTPRDIAAQLSTAIRRALEDPETRDRLVGQGFVVTYLDPDAMAALIKRDLAYWKKSINDIGLKLEP